LPFLPNLSVIFLGFVAGFSAMRFCRGHRRPWRAPCHLQETTLK